MPFITKLNLQDNRQHRLPTRQSNDLSGTTVFGVPFSAMTTGPDPTNSGTTGSLSFVTTNFSGNTGTTVFSFPDPAMDIGASSLSAITPSNSGVTQQTGNVFVGNTSQIVDGNLSYLDYTGTSFDFEVSAMTETSPGIFTGSGVNYEVIWLSADTLDYTGRTIWNDTIGISRTEKLIVSEGAVAGYVLKGDSEGMATWQPDNSGGTVLWTAGTGTAGSMVQANSSGVSSGNLSIVGGSGNSSAGNLSVILGGYGHLMTFGTDIGGIFAGANHTISGGVDTSVVIGGVSNTLVCSYSGIFAGGSNQLQGSKVYSAMMAGNDNYLNANRSVMLGGQNMTGTSDDTVYVPNFNINSIGSGTSISNLGIDVNGYVVSGVTGGAFTGNTSGDCINDMYVSNIHSCSPLNINPNNEGNIYFGQLSANTFDLTNNRLGIGIMSGGSRTTDPLDALELGEGEWIGFNTTTSPAANSTAGIHFKEGVATGFNGYGVDMYYNATSGDDRLIIEGVFAAVRQGGMMVHRSGNIGIGMDLTGSTAGATLQIGETGNVASLKFVDGNQAVDKVLVSDVDGLTNWGVSRLVGSIDNTFGTGTTNSTILGGSGHTINDDVTNSSILGGNGITADTNDTTYVPDLVIDGLVSTDPLATDANGKVIAGASDRRLKENITDLTGGLDKIQNLRGVSYEWTEESNMGEGVHYGLIAQEVQEVIPDMVRERAKGDGMLTLSYTEIVPWLIEAIKEMSSDEYVNTRLETQTIVAEDNSIELNYGGTHATANSGGISVKDGVNDGVDSFIKIDETGRWIIGPALTTAQLTLPEYTPQNTSDEIGGSGDVVWDDSYLYIKTNNGWRRTGLETF